MTPSLHPSGRQAFQTTKTQQHFSSCLSFHLGLIRIAIGMATRFATSLHDLSKSNLPTHPKLFRIRADLNCDWPTLPRSELPERRNGRQRPQIKCVARTLPL